MDTILTEPEYIEKNKDFAKGKILFNSKKVITTNFDELLDKKFLDKYFNLKLKLNIKKEQ
tara:strand:- start:1917 stop:2096 length:180 start_codon:yes stop_codon:yes gene_type:complete